MIQEPSCYQDYCDGKVLIDWLQSFIICLYRKIGAAETGQRQLKLMELAMQILERIVNGL